jgi:hypothetical protein
MEYGESCQCDATKHVSKQDDQKTQHKFRTAGALEGKIIIHDDFDEPLEDIKEYM